MTRWRIDVGALRADDNRVACLRLKRGQTAPEFLIVELLSKHNIFLHSGHEDQLEAKYDLIRKANDWCVTLRVLDGSDESERFAAVMNMIILSARGNVEEGDDDWKDVVEQVTKDGELFPLKFFRDALSPARPVTLGEALRFVLAKEAHSRWVSGVLRSRQTPLALATLSGMIVRALKQEGGASLREIIGLRESLNSDAVPEWVHKFPKEGETRVNWRDNGATAVVYRKSDGSCGLPQRGQRTDSCAVQCSLVIAGACAGAKEWRRSGGGLEIPDFVSFMRSTEWRLLAGILNGDGCSSRYVLQMLLEGSASIVQVLDGLSGAKSKRELYIAHCEILASLESDFPMLVSGFDMEKSVVGALCRGCSYVRTSPMGEHTDLHCFDLIGVSRSFIGLNTPVLLQNSWPGSQYVETTLGSLLNHHAQLFAVRGEKVALRNLRELHLRCHCWAEGYCDGRDRFCPEK